MGIIFTLFKIIGIDLSQYNDNPNTPTAVNGQKLKDLGIDFVAVRSTLGQVLDKSFKLIWSELKGFVLRIQYHYLDYYSHISLGISPVTWGERQAVVIDEATNKDNDGTIVFIDVEKASIAPTIEAALSTVQTITQACLLKLDALNGRLNGLYLSLSYLKYFMFAKHRPLWLALYNEYYTPEQTVALARKAGWTGPIYIWQYASDGDIDDDGIADGLKMGLESAAVDLNLWIESDEAFNNFGKVTVNNPNPSTPPKEPQTKEVQLGKTLTDGQLVRTGPGTAYPYGTIKMKAGMTVEILAIAKDPMGNIWLRIGYNQWIAQIHKGVTFVNILYK